MGRFRKKKEKKPKLKKAKEPTVGRELGERTVVVLFLCKLYKQITFIKYKIKKSQRPKINIPKY